MRMAATLEVTDRPGSVELPAIGPPSSTPGHPSDRRHRRAPDAGRNVDAHVCSRSSEAGTRHVRSTAWPPPSPLPQRAGVDPVRLRLPGDGAGSAGRPYGSICSDGTVPLSVPRGWRRCSAEGRFVTAEGPGPARATPDQVGGWGRVHRDPPEPEAEVPYEVGILYRDSDLLVIDKPHFLATMPRGFYIVESALVRLRRDLDLPDLARAPAGPGDGRRADVLVRPEQRGAYQPLFRDRQVTQVLRGRRSVRPGDALPADGAQPDRQGTRGDPRRGGAGRRTPRPTSSCSTSAAGGPYRLHPAHRPNAPAAAAHARPRPADPRRPVLRPALVLGTRRWTTGPGRCSCSPGPPWSSPTRSAASAAPVREQPVAAGLDGPHRMGRRSPPARVAPSHRTARRRTPPRPDPVAAHHRAPHPMRSHPARAAAPRPRRRTPARAVAQRMRPARLLGRVRRSRWTVRRHHEARSQRLDQQRTRRRPAGTPERALERAAVGRQQVSVSSKE